MRRRVRGDAARCRVLERRSRTLFPDHLALVNALLKREVDIAWNTPMAHTVTCDIDIQHATKIVARRSSDIESMKDLAGPKVALGNIETAELNDLPKCYLKQQRLDLDKQATLVNLNDLVDDRMSRLSTATYVIAAIETGSAKMPAPWASPPLARFRSTRHSPFKLIWTSLRFPHCIMTATDDTDLTILAAFNLKSLDAMQGYFRRVGEKKFTYVLYGTSAQLLNALLTHNTDIAWRSPLAHARAQVRDHRILAPLASDSEANCHLEVVVQNDPDIEKLGDLKGKSLILGSNELSALSELELPLSQLKVTSISSNLDATTEGDR